MFRTYLSAGAVDSSLWRGSLDLAYTAAGVYDGFFEFRLSAWDLAAGVVLIRGGRWSGQRPVGWGRLFAERQSDCREAQRCTRALLEAVQQHALAESLLDELAPLEQPAE